MDSRVNNLNNFWEASFQEKREMWGFIPANAAFMAAAFFKANSLNNILVPGFGYGRNVRPFLDHGMKITGIEISETAISLAKKYLKSQFPKIYHGSVAAMPFNKERYDGIFCYCLIHLLDEPARIKLIQDSYNQLEPGGYMVFVAVSKRYPSFGQGKPLGKDRYETIPGVTLYFYDTQSIQKEFGQYGLVSYQEITEGKENKANQQAEYWYITCKK